MAYAGRCFPVTNVSAQGQGRQTRDVVYSRIRAQIFLSGKPNGGRKGITNLYHDVPGITWGIWTGLVGVTGKMSMMMVIP